MKLAIIALLLSQTPAPMAVQDPLTGKKARVEDCGSAKQCLDVNVISTAVPTGAATSAKQDTGNASLASIDGKVATDATLSALLDGGTAQLAATALEARSTRQLLELILVELQQHTQSLATLKDPGR